LGEFLPCPSAILEGIDTAALLIWLVNPYISVVGNLEVSTYTSLTNSTASFHTRKSRYDLDFSELTLISLPIHTENGKRETENYLYDLDFSELTLISLPIQTENGKRETENRLHFVPTSTCSQSVLYPG
jgi:hypothetical protein